MEGKFASYGGFIQNFMASFSISFVNSIAVVGRLAVYLVAWEELQVSKIFLSCFSK